MPDRAGAQLPLEDYRRALDESAIVAMTDPRGRITYVNERFCATSGYSAEELLGHDHRLLNSGLHEPAFWRELWTTIKRGQVWRGRIRNRAKDGRLYWVDTTITPFLDEAGAPERYLSIRFDVSAYMRTREELRDTEGRFRALFENAGVGMALIAPDHRIVDASPALGRLLGYPREALIGRNFTDFTDRDTEARDEGLFAKLMTGERDDYDVTKRYTRADGGTFWGRTTVSVVRGTDERSMHILGIVRDVSELQHAEARMREQAALVRLGEMAAVVAHEVKNPLAGILAAVKVIGSRLPPEGDEQRVVETIAARIAGLNGLIEQLLGFARPQEPRRVHLDLHPVLERVRHVAFAEEPGRLVVRGPNACVDADGELLERLFLNLALNANEAMEGQGEVEVELEPRGEQVDVAFRDRGPGIPQGLRTKVLEPFFTTKTRGAGLGLATARRIVEAHDGSLRFADREGGGAAVIITLPRCEPVAPS